MLTALLFLLQHSAPPAMPGAPIYAHLEQGRYLSALAEAELTEGIDAPGSLLADTYGLVLSFLSLERETLEVFDRMGSAGTKAVLASSPLDEAESEEALAAIVAAAKGRRIVILNESHHMPRHRAFAAELARALRAEGFTWFGAEAFADIAGTVERGHPTATSGYYVQEPVFGELVRTVLELGYRAFPYEVEERLPPGADARTRINHRETHQARNIVQRCFEVDPEARVFLYVGYSHATENWTDRDGPGETAWMAARLDALTGHDPLTIDQTVTSPRSTLETSDPHWRRAAEAGKLATPRVFRTRDGAPLVVGQYAGQVDLQVFHPPLGELHGRPDWLARGRKSLAPPAALVQGLPEGTRFLAQAFRADEPDTAIPSDQFVFVTGASVPHFLLVPDTYRLRVMDEDGEVRARVEKLEVD